jgi:hypothetical protein
MRFLRSVGSLIFLAIGISCYPQQKPAILTDKIAPARLREDATLFQNVTLAMHPAVGIYKSRAYYGQLFSSFIQSLNDSLTLRDFRLRTKLVADELHCGHTEVLYSKKYYKVMSKQKLNYSPYVFLPVQNKVYVFATMDRKADSTLKRGTEILSINGIPVDSMLRYCKRFISTDGFNRTAKNHYIQLSFNSFYLSLFGRPDTFKVEYLDGKIKKQLRYPAIQPRTIPPMPLGPKEDSLLVRYKRAKMKHRFLDEEHKTLLLKIERFSRKRTDKAYRKIFRKLHKNQSQNLVLDLRNNGGGSLENSYRLLSYLVDSVKTQTLRTGIKNYPYKKHTHGNVLFRLTRLAFTIIGKKVSRNDTDNFIYTIKPRKKNHFNGKVLVLINGGSFSASCLVAAYLKDRRNTVFIGEETGGAIEGCNAGITPYYKLPNSDIRIRMPAFRIVHDVHPQITGHGILPDYEIVYGIKDILAKKDLELIKAKELLHLQKPPAVVH